VAWLRACVGAVLLALEDAARTGVVTGSDFVGASFLISTFTSTLVSPRLNSGFAGVAAGVIATGAAITVGLSLTYLVTGALTTTGATRCLVSLTKSFNSAVD
jgi:hypothetical protein